MRCEKNGCCLLNNVSRPVFAAMQTLHTLLPADSVEFCPHPDASNIFVCGTYKLEDQQNDQLHIRRGQCLVFEVLSEHSEHIDVYAALVLLVRSLPKDPSALRLRRYLFLLFWISNGEMVSLLPGRTRVWSDSQVSHPAESPAITSSSGRRGQRESVRVESSASFVLTALSI